MLNHTKLHHTTRHHPQPLIMISQYSPYPHRTYAAAFNTLTTLDVMLCDEGHRLKNAYGTGTTLALGNCCAIKRLLLTGGQESWEALVEINRAHFFTSHQSYVFALHLLTFFSFLALDLHYPYTSVSHSFSFPLSFFLISLPSKTSPLISDSTLPLPLLPPPHTPSSFYSTSTTISPSPPSFSSSFSSSSTTSFSSPSYSSFSSTSPSSFSFPLLYRHTNPKQLRRALFSGQFCHTRLPGRALRL